MFLRRSLALFLCLVISGPSLGQVADPWQGEIENLRKLNDAFYEICFDKNGNFLKDHIISSGEVHIDCNGQALALEEHYNALKENIEAYPQGSSGELVCSVNPSKGPEDALAFLSQNLDVNQCKKESDGECAQGIVCNAMNSFMTGPMGINVTSGLVNKAESLYSKLGLDPKRSQSLQTLKKCSSQDTGGGCALNLLRGVWDSLYSTVTGMWELLKFGYKKAKQGLSYVVDSIGSWFSDVEDATSDKMMAAQNIEDSMLDKFLADPLGFVADLAKSVVRAVWQAAKDHYGCEKWSGSVYTSKCLRPMSNWGCASCNQKMNVMCGMGGFIVGEVVTAYLTGGAAAATEVAGKSAMRIGSKALGRVAKALKVIPKADEAIVVASKAGNVAAGAGKLLGKFALKSWKKLGDAISFKAVAKAARKVRIDLVKGMKIVKRTKVYQGAAKGAQVGFAPVRSYLHLMDEAFNRGFYQTHKALGSGQKALRLSTINNLERSIKAGLDASNSKIKPKALAKDYARVVLKNNTSDIAQTEAAAKEIHNVWKKHYAHRKNTEPEMFVAYEKLSAENKMRTMETLKDAINSKGSKEFQREHFKTYIFNLEVELAKEKLFLFVSKDNRLNDYLERDELENAAREAFKFISIDEKMRKSVGLSNASTFDKLSETEKQRLYKLVENSRD